jgi:membrane-bound lytic murein transglycosylase F
MERRAISHLLYLLAALLIFGLLAVLYIRTSQIDTSDRRKHEIVCVDLPQILERGRIDVSLGYNSLNYYILHGRPGGFQFQLAKYFADHLGVDMSILVIKDIHEAMTELKSGKTDIVCSDLTKIDGRFGEEIMFSDPYKYINQVLIQQKNNPLHPLVRTIDELEGKTIYIPRGSLFHVIIENETRHLQNPPYIIEVPGYSSEQLIDAVAQGNISFTVADFHLAKYHAALYKNIDVDLQIGNEKPLAWCMRSRSPMLIEALNTWLDNFNKTREFGYLVHRYFVNPWKVEKSRGDYFSVKQGKISPYDDIIKKHSQKISWDWRLIASLIYEESQFRHDLVSYSGAYGIMQMIPVTAENFGVGPESSVEDHIRAGIRFIKFMDDNFRTDVPDSLERLKFVLASYNLGEGHIRDAMALAEKYNRNPRLWDKNVEFFLIAKARANITWIM